MARTKKKDDTVEALPTSDGWGTPVAGTHSLAGANPLAAERLRDDDRVKGQPGRARTWLILLASLVAQLVVIGAAGNPGVVGSSSDYARDHAGLLGRFVALPALLSWRVKQPTVDPGNLLASEWFGLLALVVVAALLSAVVLRGPVTFWRAGVTVWMAVLVGTLANGMVRRGVVNDRGRYDQIGGKAAGVLFTGTGYEVIAGVIIGLIAALVAAIVAVATRRPAELVLPDTADEPASYVDPTPPPPWHGDESQSGIGYAAPYGAAYGAASPDSSSDSSSDAPQHAAPELSRDSSYASPYSASYGSSYGSSYGGAADSDSATTTFPAQPSADERRSSDETTQFAAAEPANEPTPESAPEPETKPAPDQTAVLPAVPPTASHSDFPRPPDDEELGHQPAEDER